MYCSVCSTEVRDDAAVCPKCAMPIEKTSRDSMYCSVCSTELHENEVACPKCAKVI